MPGMVGKLPGAEYGWAELSEQAGLPCQATGVRLRAIFVEPGGEHSGASGWPVDKPLALPSHTLSDTSHAAGQQECPVSGDPWPPDSRHHTLLYPGEQGLAQST